MSPKLRYIEPLPQKPVYHMAQSGINFNPEWPIRVNVNHILGDEENLERIPAKIRKAKNLPLLFETAVELGRRKAVIEPWLVVPQGYQGRVQYLLPVYLTNMQKPDLAMTLTVMDGYYLGDTERGIQSQAAGGWGADCGTGAEDGAVRRRGARHGGGRERQAGKPAKAHGAVRHAGGRGIFRRGNG